MSDIETQTPADPFAEKVTATSPAPAPFAIYSEDEAGRALRKIAVVESEIARVKAQAAARVAELQADANALHGRYDAGLEAWAKDEVVRRKRKSVTLLDGTLSFRTVPGRFKVIDREAALTHAQNDETLRNCVGLVAVLDEAQYIAEIESTGALLPGVDRVPARESFSISFAKPKGEGSVAQ